MARGYGRAGGQPLVGTDETQTSNWRWNLTHSLTTNPMTYSNWAPNEPNDQYSDQVMYLDVSGKWDNMLNVYNGRFICEVNMD